MIINITRSQLDTIGGGFDTITLAELLKDYGYVGIFDIDVIDDSHNTYEVIHSHTIDNRLT